MLLTHLNIVLSKLAFQHLVHGQNLRHCLAERSAPPLGKPELLAPFLFRFHLPSHVDASFLPLLFTDAVALLW